MSSWIARRSFNQLDSPPSLFFFAVLLHLVQCHTRLRASLRVDGKAQALAHNAHSGALVMPDRAQKLKLCSSNLELEIP